MDEIENGWLDHTPKRRALENKKGVSMAMLRMFLKALHRYTLKASNAKIKTSENDKSRLVLSIQEND